MASASGGGKEGPLTPKCPVCLQIFQEAYLTKCGHSFCYACITQHLQTKSACPICRNPLTARDIFPNRALTKVVKLSQQTSMVTNVLESFLAKSGDKLGITEINALVSELAQQRKVLQLEEDGTDKVLCEEFLEKALKDKELQQQAIQKDIDTIKNDMKLLRETGSNKRLRVDYEGVNDSTKADWNSEEVDAAKFQLPDNTKNNTQKVLFGKRQRIQQSFKDLEVAYFEAHREKDDKGPREGLKLFQKHISRFSRFSKFDIFAQISYQTPGASSTIVSSIEFDRDDEYFATAGVTKEIKMYEYQSIVNQPNVEVHSPIRVMSCRAKISCLSWNPYLKEQIASSDYEGIVSCWDSRTGDRIAAFEDHEKRAWSVDFSPTKPTLIASGSDDHKVIIWDTGLKHCVAKISAKANVCCVKFNPKNSNYIAFGSADHHIHYFDLRNLKREVHVFKGHAKAVSYVRFLSENEMISASTDSTLKLWRTDAYECTRTFTGHTNEKNFVGLTTSDDYIACGSENNSVYCYHKCLPKPIVSCNFSQASKTKDPRNDETPFVSSVCWKKSANVLLAANSHGTINVMTLSR
eukprot:m.109490 g.109490  ORF g.109490 m.109490 type:complete len:579 (+) comp14003_c2_seq3:719-2455(+)